MARLHEYQAKSLLRRAGVQTPRGQHASTPQEAEQAARDLAGPVVVKIQAWTTGRKAIGGVAFAKTPAEARAAATGMLAMTVGQFPVTQVLVEEQLPPAHELFVSLAIDDKARSPVLLLAVSGGSGIEERAGEVTRVPCSLTSGPDGAAIAAFLAKSSLPPASHAGLATAFRQVFSAAQTNEARSLEVNPLAVLGDGRVVALDCRATIDDYAVFRHPDLGIDIARELDHPPTDLERTAYLAEQADHRGTFFFAQMNTTAPEGSKGLIGFHGAGGGGSMMSMDAIASVGFTLANFCDTSGNPSPAKVYRASRIILAQPGLIGYFGSGSGVANQEQYWSAYGLAKAFWELELSIPAVIRLGGNTEDRAVDILTSACKDLPASVEAFKKTDTPAAIARRFAELVADAGAGRTSPPVWKPRAPRRPAFVGAPGAHHFAVKGGRVWIDPQAWKSSAPAIVSRAAGLLVDRSGVPALTGTAEEFLAKDSEMIACEVECRRDGIPGVFVALDLPGLDPA